MSFRTLSSCSRALALVALLGTVACRKSKDYDNDGMIDGDCDPYDASAFAGAPEVCDNRDNDCDGAVDNGVGSQWFTDGDGDGFGDDASAVASCFAIDGTVTLGGDCADDDPRRHPGASEVCGLAEDLDCDGTAGTEDGDEDGAAACLDCDDADDAVHPGASETCNDVDDDCDGEVDDDATDATTWYADLDADTHGSDVFTATACDAPTGFVAEDDDCDDLSAAAYPGAPEDCDGADNDCDGTIDDGATGTSTWYADADQDGYGDGTTSESACSRPAGYVDNADDCDDTDDKYNPAATESCTDPNDYNCDGSVGQDDADADGTPACSDCDDSRPDVEPGANEVCDDVDNDCNGLTDESAPTWYADLDGDTHGNQAVAATQCAAPAGFVSSSDDCDDLTPATYPGATEACDGRDNDCVSGVPVDESDADGDRWAACVGDCDDADKTQHPGAVEVCNAADDDCDGTNDETAVDASPWYADTDKDGAGTGAATWACASPGPSYAATAGDCDDANAAKKPGATEVCNATDDDCDGAVDEAGSTGTSTYYLDADGDGVGGSKITVAACAAPAGYVTTSNDCDDLAAATYPGATEACDGKDNDCASGVPANESDADKDGQRICAGDCDDTSATAHIGGVELCNGKDDNCVGGVDESGLDGTRWYADGDKDGYGTGAGVVACTAPPNTAASAGDCNDASATVRPNAAETCNTIDDDCDGTADNNPVDGQLWYQDADGDKHGLATNYTIACTTPSGRVANNDDCNDTNNKIYGGAPEVWYNGVDDACNGGDDYDQDGDGERTTAGGKGNDCVDDNPAITSCKGLSATSPGRDCDDVHTASPSLPSGLYYIDTDGSGALATFQAYCDMTTQGGGWTLVGSVVTQSATFWVPGTYTAANGARSVSIGTPDPGQNYVMALPQWRQMLANKGTASLVRMTVRRIDNDQDVTLGFLRGLQMGASGQWTANPNAAFKGDFTTQVTPATSACVLQYNSDISVGLSNTYFNAPDGACTGQIGWNGSCGYTVFGHPSGFTYAGSNPGSNFGHACSLDLNYYCSGDNMSGSGGSYCYFKRKWYWIR